MELIWTERKSQASLSNPKNNVYISEHLQIRWVVVRFCHIKHIMQFQIEIVLVEQTQLVTLTMNCPGKAPDNNNNQISIAPYGR